MKTHHELLTIVASYQDGTLATQPDMVLYDAQMRVAVYHDWRIEHPEYTGNEIPELEELRQIFDFLDNLLTVRYGCND